LRSIFSWHSETRRQSTWCRQLRNFDERCRRAAARNADGGGRARLGDDAYQSFLCRRCQPLFHSFTFLFPRDLKNDIARWQTIKTAASDTIARAGGTISHHHGVGEDHKAWLEAEKGATGIGVLRAIKRELDPAGVLNPGKMVP